MDSLDDTPRYMRQSRGRLRILAARTAVYGESDRVGGGTPKAALSDEAMVGAGSAG